MEDMTLDTSWRNSWRKIDRRPIWEWAHDNLSLRAPYTITGRFNLAEHRHFIEPFIALQDDYTREVNILKPVRGGGSLIGDIHFAWAMANDPGPYLNAFQKDPIADSHWDERLLQLLEQINVLPVSALTDKQLKRFKREEAHLRNGFTCYTFGPSINNLQSRGIRFIRLDELWLYPEMLSEAIGRLGDYIKQENYKLIVISQGGPMPGCKVEEDGWYAHWNGPTSEINEWEVQCAGCGEYFRPKFFDQRKDGKWAGAIWDKDKLDSGKLNVSRALETVRFESPCCGFPNTDEGLTKANWNRTGRYTAVTPKNVRKRGFHWEAVIDFPWVKLADFWLSACAAFDSGVIEPKIAFRQKYCAQFADERTIMESDVRMPRVSYEVNTLQPGEVARFMTTDKQSEDLYWWTVRAWMSGGKSRRLGFGKARGFAELEATRVKFYVPKSNIIPKDLLPSNNHGVDSAFEAKGERGVYAACIYYGWIACRGEDKPFYWHSSSKGRIMRSYSQLSRGDPEIGTKGQGRRYAPLIFFSKPTYNQRVQNLIDNGKWEEPIAQPGDEMDAEYARQMAQRIRRTEYNKKTNSMRVFWWEGKNDHARDLANMQILFATLAKVLPDELVETEKTT